MPWRWKTRNTGRGRQRVLVFHRSLFHIHSSPGHAQMGIAQVQTVKAELDVRFSLTKRARTPPPSTIGWPPSTRWSSVIFYLSSRRVPCPPTRRLFQWTGVASCISLLPALLGLPCSRSSSFFVSTISSQEKSIVMFPLCCHHPQETCSIERIEVPQDVAWWTLFCPWLTAETMICLLNLVRGRVVAWRLMWCYLE